MRRLLPAGVAVLAAAWAAGCGGEGLTPASEATDRQVRAVFSAYTQAMGRGDWTAACRHLAPESIDRFRQGAKQFVAKPPQACPDLLDAVFSRATAKARRQLHEIARTARVRDVRLGDRGPTIRWSAEVDGKRVPVTQQVRRINGEYKLVSVQG